MLGLNAPAGEQEREWEGGRQADRGGEKGNALSHALQMPFSQRSSGLPCYLSTEGELSGESRTPGLHTGRERVG